MVSNGAVSQASICMTSGS